MDLAELLRWFQDHVTAPPDRAAPDDPRIADRLAPSASMSAGERLGVYTRMYFARLREALETDFPALRARLGDAAFSRLARRYVTERPSTHYSLNHLGHDLVSWMSERAEAGDLELPAHAIDVARLEWSIVRVFHAPADDPLDRQALGAIPPEEYLEVRFEPVRAVALHAFAAPVSAFVSAARERRELPPLDDRETYTLVHRPDDWVRRRDLEPTPSRLLRGLLDGRSLGEALDEVSSLPGADPAAVAARIGEWFREWTAWGLFRAVSR